MCAQLATQFLGGQGTAVQAESVAGFLRGEPVIEDSDHVLGGDSHSSIGHRNLHASSTSSDAHRHIFYNIASRPARVLRIADEIDENLKHLVFVHGDLRNSLELLDDRNGMPLEAAVVDRRLSSTSWVRSMVSVAPPTLA